MSQPVAPEPHSVFILFALAPHGLIFNICETNNMMSLSSVMKQCWNLYFISTSSYQYLLCIWLFLCRWTMCSTISSLLARRRAPVAFLSSFRQGSSWDSELIFIPSIILERTGSTDSMDVPSGFSETQQIASTYFFLKTDFRFKALVND